MDCLAIAKFNMHNPKTFKTEFVRNKKYECIKSNNNYYITNEFGEVTMYGDDLGFNLQDYFEFVNM